MTDKRNRHTKEQYAHIAKLVAEYVEQNGVTSTREIADAVKGQTGFDVYPALVSDILQGLGYIPTTRRIWSKA